MHAHLTFIPWIRVLLKMGTVGSGIERSEFTQHSSSNRRASWACIISKQLSPLTNGYLQWIFFQDNSGSTQEGTHHTYWNIGFKHRFGIHGYVHGVVTPVIGTRTKTTLNLYRKPAFAFFADCSNYSHLATWDPKRWIPLNPYTAEAESTENAERMSTTIEPQIDV